MSIVDILIVAAFLIGFVLGFKDGFVRKLIGLIGFAAAIFLAIVLSSPLGKVIENVFGIEYYLAEIIAGIAVFMAIMIVVSVLKRLVHPYDKVNSFINQMVGGVIGSIQMLFFASGVLFVLHVFDIPKEEETVKSIFYKEVYSILPATIEYISNYAPEPKKVIRDYINDKDSLK